ncbi:MAG: tetratricopeptide repeat protein [Desulfuromonadaceae bacterium]|nr:tetratricopeptide repeat protein [Desulfuromonadaceae bacterium]MDD2855346.1 tetratricopeptide repeat protein [Desulfuromonadaceae bacterium]
MKLKKYLYYMLDALILLAAVVAVYGRLAGYSFQTALDDNIYIMNNPISFGFSWDNVRAAFNITANKPIGQYNPLSMLSFMLDFTIWRGLNPEGYHLTNIVVHLLNGLLVYRLLLRLHGERLIALLATAIFLLHPVQVESVGWISERKGLLSLFFMLISWESYCRYRDADNSRGKLLYGVSVLSFTLSLLAKSAGVILPVILLLYDFCFGRKDSRLRLKDKIPYFIAAGIFSAIEIYLGQSKTGGATVGYHGGSPVATFYTMLTVFCRYFRLLLWPSGLNVEHLPPVYRSPDIPVVAAFLLLSVMAYASYRLFICNRKFGFWVLFFWIGLLPVSQIIPQILMMYEHYLYMPIIGIGALVGYGVSTIREKIPKAASHFLYPLIVIWMIVLSITSYQRVPVWENSLTLFSDATTKSPHGARVWEALGEVHRYYGNNEASRVALERSLKLKPDSTDVLWGLAQLHSEKKELEIAEDYLKRLFKINPDYVMGWATRGNIALDQKEYSKAREMYNKALSIQPEAVQVNNLLGKLAIVEKKYDEARRQFGIIEADPRKWKLAENAYQMVRVESLAGRADVAAEWLEKALYRGYPDYYTLNTNMELTTLWNSPRFGYLMQQYFPEEEARR